MKLRTQLLLAFLILSVLPLSVLVLYSFNSSQRAFRQAVEGEALVLADEMSERLESTKDDLEDAVVSLGRLAMLPTADGAPRVVQVQELERQLERQGGIAGTLVDKLELSVRAPEGPEGPGQQVEQRLQVIWMPETPAGGADTAEKEEKTSPADALEAAMHAAREAFERVREAQAAAPVPGRETGPSAGPKVAGDPIALASGLFARIRGEDLMREVLARTPRDRGEVPFAFDVEGRLFTENLGDREQLLGLPPELLELGEQNPQISAAGGWIVAKRPVADSKITFAVARPVRDSLEQIRRAAVRNLFYGLGLIALALLGILPFSAHLTRHLTALTRGAERIAAGDLQARVAVRSENEIGQLARSFNHMTASIERLIADSKERQRLESELAIAQEVQAQLFPREAPRLPSFEVLGVCRPARAVSGDFYDYVRLSEHRVALSFGDV
ncbi:MAG: HAMP domain-containing protein, partial [Acidobacteria bacterium]|nr:HAMP domain-containing protein [Acidobacteriota bacterium]